MDAVTARNMTDKELKAVVPPTIEILQEIYNRFGEGNFSPFYNSIARCVDIRHLLIPVSPVE